MSAMTAALGAPQHHALQEPDCDCGLCVPSWARRRGEPRRFTEPVSLLAALADEESGCRAWMVERHCAALSTLLAAVEDAWADADDPDQPGVGIEVVLFAGELAAAVRAPEVRADLPASLVAEVEQTVTAAVAVAAECLTELMSALAALAALAEAVRA